MDRLELILNFISTELYKKDSEIEQTTDTDRIIYLNGYCAGLDTCAQLLIKLREDE